MSNNQCQFEPSTQTSSATICKWCGKEKRQHNKQMNNTNNKEQVANSNGAQTENKKIAKEFLRKNFETIEDVNDIIQAMVLFADMQVDKALKSVTSQTIQSCNTFLSKINDTSGLCKFCNTHKIQHTGDNNEQQ